MSIYKDCDIRGVFRRDFNNHDAYLIGRAWASLFPESARMVVGGDVRTSTSVLKKALIQGLSESGSQVFDLGTVTTPLFSFGVDSLKADGGVMITASHNPAEYNGFKFSLGIMPPTITDIERIRSLVENKTFRNISSPLPPRFFDLREAYCTNLASLLPSPRRRLRVVTDCGNGSQTLIAPSFLKNQGFEVIPLFCEVDGSFPHRSPNPAQENVLTALSNAVRKKRAQAGIAFDGDGDRVVFVDERGKILPPETSIIFFLHTILPTLRRGEKFVYDLKCSRVVPQQVLALGGIPVEERSGYTFIKTRMFRENAFMAAEISGHYFFRELGRDDGLYAAALFLSSLSRFNTSLSKVTADFPQPHVTPDIRIPSENQDHVLTVLEESLRGEKVSKVDGLRAEWPEGWALIRKSVTEPVFTLRFEAEKAQDLPILVRRLLRPFPEMEQEVLTKIPHLGE